MLTDRLKIWQCSTPFSLEMPANSANVGSSNLAKSTYMFYFGSDHSSNGTVFRVNMVSSM